MLPTEQLEAGKAEANLFFLQQFAFSDQCSFIFDSFECTMHSCVYVCIAANLVPLETIFFFVPYRNPAVQ